MSKRVFIGILIAMLSVVGACAQAGVVPPLQLTDYLGPNTTVNIDPYTPAGVYEWLVDGTSHMTQNSYWYRIGNSGPAAPMSSLASITIIPGMDFSADVLYSGSAFDFQITYALMGSDAGTGNSDLAQTLQITNNTGSSLDLHLFEYVNMDLNGTPADETALWVDGASLTQSDGATLGLLTPNPTPNAWELGDATALLAKLNGGSAFSLANNDSYTGDAACVFQWDMTIGAFGSAPMISQDNGLMGGVVPEPTSAVAFVSMLGLLPLLRRKRH